jgi:hypothetical protein
MGGGWARTNEGSEGHACRVLLQGVNVAWVARAPHHASALAVAGAHASVARAGWAQQRQHRPRFHSPLPAAAFSLPSPCPHAVAWTGSTPWSRTLVACRRGIDNQH